MRLTGLPVTYGVDPWSFETTQQLPLGSIGFDYYGNKYRYVLFDAANNGVAGNLVQTVPQPANFVDLAVASAAALLSGSPATQPNRTVTLTLGGTATTANQFTGGRAVVSVTPGLGTQYTIASHDVQATTTGACKFNFEENLLVALTTSSKMTVMPHPYNGTVASPTTPTGYSAGVLMFALPKATYGWVGTTGVFGVLSDATLGAIGNGISPSTTTAGCITRAVTLKDSIGYYIVTPVSAQVEPEWFNIG
jgi:hypothetical protein